MREKEFCKKCGREYNGQYPCPKCGSLDFVKESNKEEVKKNAN